MFVKKEDLNIMIKMENIIGMHEKIFWGKNKDKPYIMKIYGETYEITYDDFISFMNIIQKEIENANKRSAKCNEYHKNKGKEYHRIYNNYWGAKKNNDIERMNYWKEQLELLKRKGD